MSDINVHHRSHKHLRTETMPGDSGKNRIVLVGNPNVGKSVVFKYLSGMYVDVSNFPGTTVEISKASYLHYQIYDTPGIYGVSSFNEEESVARDIILNADIIINVVDAVHLERDLFLTQQLIDMGKRVGIVVNMIDEAEHHKLEVDLSVLEIEFGVPVIGTVAVRSRGLEKIHELIIHAREGKQHADLHARLHEMLATVGSQGEALLVLEGDHAVAERHGIEPMIPAVREEIYIERRNRVNRIVQSAVRDREVRTRISSTLGRMTVNPWLGVPILATVLLLMYLFVGVFIAQDIVQFTEVDIGQRVVEFGIKRMVGEHAGFDLGIDLLDEAGGITATGSFRFPDGISTDSEQWATARNFSSGHVADHHFSFHNSLIILGFGEFGAVTMTVRYLGFLLLPLVFGFYFALSVLEDSGYLPRLATLVDRLLRLIGLNGKAVIPIILGFGCVTMATITTRLLGNQREKTIATTILQLAIPCSAQLGVIAALLAVAGGVATLVYVVVIFTFLVMIGTVLQRRLPGETSPLLLDLPPMRIPQVMNVLQKTSFKTWFFMKEAGPWFFFGALAVSILLVSGAIVHIQDALEPIVVSWLQLPPEAAIAFVMGLVRRDFGAAGLYEMNLSAFQIVAALVTITLFVPCIASLMVMFKERGLKEGFAIWIGSLLLALGVGGIVSQILI